jgi:hypothetical protein
MYVMDQPSKSKDYIHLVEFAYNNGYQASLKMSPFEALYGRKCNTIVSWDNPIDRAVIGTNVLKDMEEQMKNIRHNLKVSQDRKTSYVDKNMFLKYFKVGKHVFLKVKTKINSLRLVFFPKLVARYCGPFEMLEMIGPVAYMMAFLVSMRLHNVFHVSLSKKYVPDLNHIIDWNVIHMEYEGDFQVELVCILDQKVKFLKNKDIVLIKV